MIKAVGDRAEVSGAMTLPGATALLAEGVALIGDSTSVFDLAAVSDVDSSALAVVFGWLREAKRQGKSIHVSNAPKDMLSLADVYGVSELLPLA